MRRLGESRIFLLCFLPIFLWGCGAAKREIQVERDFVLQPGMKIQVADVSNETGEIFDVDVIGLLWDALEAKLHQEELLWTGNPRTAPLQMEAFVREYSKGNALQRWTMPGLGSTVLDARVDLKAGDVLIASVEIYRKIGTGDGLTIGGWRKVFGEVAEDVVTQLRTQLAGPRAGGSAQGEEESE